VLSLSLGRLISLRLRNGHSSPPYLSSLSLAKVKIFGEISWGQPKKEKKKKQQKKQNFGLEFFSVSGVGIGIGIIVSCLASSVNNEIKNRQRK